MGNAIGAQITASVTLTAIRVNYPNAVSFLSELL